MLSLMRQHAGSWVVKVALFLIVIVFIFWGGYAYNSREETQIAKVGDQYVSVADYNAAYNQMIEMYRRQMGDAFSEDFIRQLDLKKQVLSMLIDRYVLAKAAQDLGLAATMPEIQQRVLELPVFQSEGRFDRERYVAVLRDNRLTPEAFEQKLAEDLSAQKVEAFVKRRAVVSEEELAADFQFNYSQIQVAYAVFDASSFESKVAVDEKALEEFYQAQKERYMDPEKRQIAYVLFKTEDFMKDVQVSEDELRQSFEENKDKYHHEPEVKARHILFKLAENASQEEVAKVRAEAQKVLEEAKKGKDFGELAKQHSQDPSAKENGGDLGFFTRAEMLESFSNAAFSMKPGEISGLVATQYGLHIIKVEEVRPERDESFDEVRPQMEKELKEVRARDKAFDKAREFGDSAFSLKNLEKAAQTGNVAVAGAGAWVSQNEPLPGMGAPSPVIMKKLFELSEKDVSQALEAPEGFLVAQVQAIQPAQVLAFDKVKAKVEKAYRAEQARKLAEAAASEFLLEAKNAKGLEVAAKDKKIEVKKSDWFSRREPDKELKLLQGESQGKIFQLEESQPFPDAPLSLGNRYLAVQLIAKRAPEGGLDKERDAIAKRLAAQKQNSIWLSWLEDQRKNSEIKIFKEL